MTSPSPSSVDQPYTTSQASHASSLCTSHWQNGTTLTSLPPSLIPPTIAAAYTAQSHITSLSSHPLWGWKIAATSIHGQKHINVDRPLAGRILRERVTPYGSPVPLGANRMLVAELEFVFRMGETLEPRDGGEGEGKGEGGYRQEEVMEAVDGLWLGSEIPDSRFEGFVTVGAEQLIADNACADRFVLGPEVTVAWRDVDLAEHAVKGWVVDENGEVGEVREGKGGNVLEDPRIAMTWIANELSRYGVPLEKGQYVTTGTCIVPLTIKPGVRAVLDYGGLGRMELEFAA
ncbi:hypothetical protein DOTSEDRAFT_23979 [Dothistroma septosporum NZE10]|uniref:Fumarylacetoacetase-like C-terminal domain-containing protein n=1 Tax=Dothistroma septosporum (strain NZE10 / CBS 128990) TaxID=675120 RepID=N1PK15_DOTSN|nr:hypothetical protein DOTSEDRAFT_23979 [Dothistroma septosporum NZE10]